MNTTQGNLTPAQQATLKAYDAEIIRANDELIAARKAGNTAAITAKAALLNRTADARRDYLARISGEAV